MIKNLEEMKQQLRELSEIVNAFKSEAVQLRVLELLLEGNVSTPGHDAHRHVTDAPSRATKTKRGTTAAKSREGKAGANSNRTGRKLGGKALLSRLYEEGFFNGTQRTIGAIVSHGDSNLATKVKQSDLSGPLAQYVRDGKLRRSKNAENQYEYVQA